MRSALLLVCSLFPLLLFSQQVEKHIRYGSENIGFYEYKPTSYNNDKNAKYPLIIFLHGIGERGNGTSELWKLKRIGIPAYIAKGEPMKFTVGGKSHSFIVLSPQCATKYSMWPTLYVDALLEYAEKNLRIDKKRIYLTGLSMGGGGTWKYISASENNAKKFAAVATVCAPSTLTNPCVVAKTKLPMWSFHASNDPIVSVSVITNAISRILGCNPAIKPLKTVWNSGGHEIWDKAYNTKHTYQTPNVFEWFLGYSRDEATNDDEPQEEPKPEPKPGSKPGNNNGNSGNGGNSSKNKAPIANAGPDKVANLPYNSILLVAAGSHDKDGYIQDIRWTKVSGPAGGDIQNPKVISARITNLRAGIYKYRITVTDNKGAKSSDDVVLRVNLPPVVRTETERILYLPWNSINLQAWRSTDPDDWIQKIQWTKISGPGNTRIETPGRASTIVSNLKKGSYWFRVTMTDAYGNAAFKDIRVSVQNRPVAHRSTLEASSQVVKADSVQQSPVVAENIVERTVLKLSPNPAKSEITVSCNSEKTGKLSVSIYDISGRPAGTYIFDKNTSYFQRTLTISGLKNGVYVTSLMVDGLPIATQRFVKE